VVDVVYLVADLLFVSKIREVARELGLEVEAAADVDALAAAKASVAIVDLRRPDAIEGVKRLSAAAIPSIGFVDHERTDVIDAAHAAGCGTVLSKGTFATTLPSLLEAVHLASRRGHG
jgi:DNA-binding NarL/FixJ family response regulator